MNYVIIGNSAAGIAGVEAIRSRDKSSRISLITEEGGEIYSRCLLSYFLAGEIKEDKLLYRTAGFYKLNGVEVFTETRCEKVLTDEKAVKLQDGKTIKFDRLLIATGARPNFPNIKGMGKDGALGLRTIRDAKSMLSSLKRVKTIVILGGGLVGLKAAYGLSAHGKAIKIIVKSGQVLSQILDKKSADIFQRWIEKRGIEVITGVEAKEILGDNVVKAVCLDNGKALDCEMVVVGKGVLPNIDIVAGTSVKTEDGIMVNERLSSNIDGIYAAGDVAQARDRISGKAKINALWPVAIEAGRIAGLNMAGGTAAYGGSMPMNSVEFFGLPLISLGMARELDGVEELIYEDRPKNIYKKLVLKGGAVVGMIFVGDIASAGVVGNLIKNKIDISSIKDIMLEEAFDFAKVASVIKANKDIFAAEEFRDIILTYETEGSCQRS